MMFGKKRKVGLVEESTINGWHPADLEFLAQSLTRDEPHIATIITGYRQMLTLDGEPYAHNLKRVGVDRKIDLGLLVQKNEIFGFYGLRRGCRVEGSFGGVSGEYDHERLDNGVIGTVGITCTVGAPGVAKTPLMDFRFVVLQEKEQSAIQNALQGSLASHGAYLNMMCERVEDIDGWMSQFREKGYSPSVGIKRIHIGAEAGKGPFD